MLSEELGPPRRAKAMTEKSFFSSKKKGKIVELRADLCSDKRDRRKEALKKIINDMTTGSDMSELFPDVVKLLQADNAETKKLVYLYLMGYARAHPDLAILAVNTFVRDCDDSNPLIRALAVRTMCCLCVSSLTQHLCDPLRKCLKDSDPYVRKTAVISVLKLFQTDENVVYDQGFLQILLDLLLDSNPTVLTNSLAVLAEIFTKSPEKMDILTFDIRLVNKLLSALNECTEWGQVIILDFLVFFRFSSEREALNVAERITSRLSHANSSVVLSAVKLLINIIGYVGTDCMATSKLLTKLSPPLVTMLSLEPEIQYVALRNINLIIQKYPMILQNDLPSFYVKYNDPLYVKIEKLAILIMLVDENNVDRVLTELKDYASEVDVEFVRKSVRAIGDCALKIESAADKCVRTLLDLIDTKISYVVQESIIVTRDIMRKFPRKYEHVIQKIGDNLFSLDEPEPRAALIWILGEFGERIENSRQFLKTFCNTFLEESSIVQMQLLTAVVKLFLKKPVENRDSVEEILSIATQKIENPDIRDRAFMYWRLLSTDPEIARKIVLAQKPPLTYKSRNLDLTLLNNLLPHISTLCSVFHKMPQSLVDSTMLLRSKSVDIPDNQLDFFSTNIPSNNLNNSENNPTSIIDDSNWGLTNSTFDLSIKNHTITNDLLSMSQIDMAVNNFPPQDSHKNLIDISLDNSSQINSQFRQLAISQSPSARSSQIFSQTDNLFQPVSETAPNIFEDFENFEKDSKIKIFEPFRSLLLSSQLGKGLEIYGHFIYENSLFLNLYLTNNSPSILTQFSLKFNVNYFGLSIGEGFTFPASLPQGQLETLKIPVVFSGNSSITLPIDTIHIAFKANQDIFYFSASFPLHYFFLESPDSKMGIY